MARRLAGKQKMEKPATNENKRFQQKQKAQKKLKNPNLL